MHVGKQIRAAREAKGLTQAELGAAVGAAHETVCRWEKGVVGISKRSLMAVQAVLGMDTVRSQGKRRKAAK